MFIGQINLVDFGLHLKKVEIPKVRSFYEDSCAILISFKSVVIFAEIKTFLKEMWDVGMYCNI